MFWFHVFPFLSVASLTGGGGVCVLKWTLKVQQQQKVCTHHERYDPRLYVKKQ